jgi:hypothetical protein
MLSGPQNSVLSCLRAVRSADSRGVLPALVESYFRAGLWVELAPESGSKTSACSQEDAPSRFSN